jgi:phosphoglycerate dehydrogenase-like enzyme
VGIVGYGSTGRQVARLLKAFGARVLATKRDAGVRADAGYTPRGFGDPQGRFVDQLFPAARLREMLPACDFVVICVPLSRATRGLIGRAELEAMKPGAYLINISRGGVVDYIALLEHLNNGRLGGAALDVFPTEPLPKGDPLWSCPNVWISPHISGYSPFYFEDAARLFVKNMRLFRAGRPLLNRFHLETG